MSRFQMYPHQSGRKTLRVRFILFYFFLPVQIYPDYCALVAFILTRPTGCLLFFLSCRDPKLVFCRIAL